MFYKQKYFDLNVSTSICVWNDESISKLKLTIAYWPKDSRLLRCMVYLILGINLLLLHVFNILTTLQLKLIMYSHRTVNKKKR